MSTKKRGEIVVKDEQRKEKEENAGEEEKMNNEKEKEEKYRVEFGSRGTMLLRITITLIPN